MRLRRQLFISFICVAVLPLTLVACYLLFTNTKLAFDLYQQGLSNSTIIQSDVLNESVRQLMVQSSRFSSCEPLVGYMEDTANHDESILQYPGIANEVSNFIDNTLNSLAVFAIIDQNNNFIHVSGSNTDTQKLRNAIITLPRSDNQSIHEFPWNEDIGTLLLFTPIGENGNGTLISVYNTENFLKTISNHSQIAASNSFIFCSEHHTVIHSKHSIDGITEFDPEDDMTNVGSSTATVGGVKSMICYASIPRTPWILVNSIPISYVNSYVLSYSVVSMLIFAAGVLIVLWLSRHQSIRILHPLNRLLESVEEFFKSGAKSIKPLELDKKTEIGYLGEKFTSMATDISAAQTQLSESNYLYNALLNATYELQISIHFEEGWITTTQPRLSKWFEQQYNFSAEQKLVHLFEIAASFVSIDIPNNLIEHKLTSTTEFEVCFDLNNIEGQWYKVVMVPIVRDHVEVIKMVLHFENITEEKQEELRLLESSQRDSLCKLLNKQALLSLMEKYVGSTGGQHAALFIDLDNFKMVNDTFGHAAGDDLLIKIGKILTSQFRPADLVARYGGDEFVVFVPGMSYERVQQKCDALLEAMSITMPKGESESVCVTASIGAYITGSIASPSEVIEQADKAMYEAKQKGKFQYCIHQDNVSY